MVATIPWPLAIAGSAFGNAVDIRALNVKQTGHILIVGQNYRVSGGSDRYMIDLAECLEAEGADVAIFAAKDDANLPSKWSRYFPSGANFTKPGLADAAQFLFSAKARSAMAKLLAETDVSLAHLNIYYGRLTSSILNPLKERCIPVVQTLHEYKLICPTYTLVANGQICERCHLGSYAPSVALRCNRGSLPRSALSGLESFVSHKLGAVSAVDHFIAISEFSKNKHIEHGVNASKITTIPNFVRVEGVSADKNVGSYVLYFGRIEQVKGVFTLLDVASRLRTRKFVFVGTGSALPALKAQIYERGLTNVELRGHLSGCCLDEAIRGALCTVLPSEWYEPFGLTILESFARGRCVVGSRIGGIPEVISHGEDGFLFNSGDAADLADKIDWLSNNPSIAAQMGARGRVKTEREFSWAAYHQRLKAVYANLGVFLK